jgi:hypothetical protein
LKRPSPAASSTSSRALDRLRVQHRLDPPLRDHRAEPAAEADVGEQLDEVDAAHGAPVDEVLPLAAAVEPPRDRDLANGELGQRAVLVVEEQLDLAEVDRLAAAEPAKRTSSGFSARSSRGASEPVAQRIASETFDLPEPFGPTTTATPGSSRTRPGPRTT